MNTVITKSYTAPPINLNEIFRYARCNDPDSYMLNLVHECLDEASAVLNYKVCYTVLPLSVKEDICDFSYFSVKSSNLTKNLQGCRRVLLFASTVGIALDRLIAKHSRLAPSRALILQAIGSERIESLNDTFCSDFETDMNIKLRPRFSPGYGDLSLDTQKQIFNILNCPKNASIFLNESLLMSPSKSVTAFAGID